MSTEIAIKVNAQNAENARNVENALIVEVIVAAVNVVAEVAAAVAHTEVSAAASKRMNAPLTGRIAMQKVPMIASKKSRRKSAVQQLSTEAGNRTVGSQIKSEIKRDKICPVRHLLSWTLTKLKLD
jgi:hypothetical protein